MTKVCKICGKEFVKSIKEAYWRFNLRKFCSQVCYHKSEDSQKGKYQKGHIGMALEKNPAWKGGRRIDEKGYVRISVGKKKWRYEHRLVVEKHIKRPLKKEEHIHHIDGNKSNNHISNLLLLPSAAEHSRFFHNQGHPL